MNQNSLEDCSGCTDSRSEGTHQMHTKQHPCKEGGDPNCGHCFPNPLNRHDTIESIVREFEEKFEEEREQNLQWNLCESGVKIFLRTALLSFSERQQEAMKVVERSHMDDKAYPHDDCMHCTEYNAALSALRDRWNSWTGEISSSK